MFIPLLNMVYFFKVQEKKVHNTHPVCIVNNCYRMDIGRKERMNAPQCILTMRVKNRHCTQVTFPCIVGHSPRCETFDG